MKLPGYGCQLSCERISCTKGGRLALHQVLAGKLCFTFTFLKPLLNCQWCSNSGVVVTHTLERILFFDLGVAVTEINTKKSIETRNKKHQKCKKM